MRVAPPLHHMIRQLSGAIHVLRRSTPPHDAEVALDPDLVLGIDRHARRITEEFDTPVAGDFARAVFTDSARAILRRFPARAPVEEETVSTSLLTDPPKGCS